MRIEEIKRGMRVFDRWWPDEIIGKITKVLKTRVHLQVYNRTIVYDNAHCQFLERCR